VNFILLITLDRLFAVKFPFGEKKITKKIAIATTCVTWTAVMLLGILPVVFVDYFSASFYTKTGLCLALPFAPAISFHARCIRSYIKGQQLQLCLDKFLSSDRIHSS
jgi:hypothetical protein